MVWIGFLLCLIIILFAGTKLARYGDVIAEKTGLGRVWVGLLLLAAITSVPEMITGVSSVALVGLPDLALGTLFGSNLFNLAILALLDAAHPYTPVLSVISLRQTLLAGGGIVLIAMAGLSILAGDWLSGVSLGWLGISSIVIFIAYLLIIRRMYRHEQGKEPSPESGAPQYKNISLKTVWLRFSLAAAAIIAAGIWVSFIGKDIVEITGWGASFVGSLFLAISTSVPELVVTFAALRLGAADMAVADILGSNMFNMAIILPVDIFYIRESIFSAASDVHVITAAAGIVMSLLVIIGIRLRQKRKTFGIISWYSPALILVYLAGFYALFVAGVA